MATKLVVDCSTGITTEVELTAEEVAQREVDAAAWAEASIAAHDPAVLINAPIGKGLAGQAKRTQSMIDKESAHAKLAALGLTSEEIAALTN